MKWEIFKACEEWSTEKGTEDITWGIRQKGTTGFTDAIVNDIKKKEDAEYICKAVNERETLLKLVRILDSILPDYMNLCGYGEGAIELHQVIPIDAAYNLLKDLEV